jgi:hypothetical protein
MGSVRLALARTVAPLVAIAVAAGSAACTTARVTATERSSIEQRLLVRSLERAAAQLDATSLVGPRARIELFTLTKDAYFAREFLRTRLETRGVRFVGPEDDADVVIRLFTAALAVDTADTLVGLPTMQAPILAVPIPEIALFKLERSRGRVEVQTYTYDRDGRLVSRLGDAKGEARYDRVTLLIFITFTLTDLDKPAEQSPAH